MKLSEISIETSLISVSALQSFEVQGLTFEMVSHLLTTEDREKLQEAFEALKGISERVQSGSGPIEDGLGAVIRQLPVLTAKVIALAAGDLTQWEKVRKFPAPVQLDALLEIGRLTFEGEDSIKKFVSGIFSLLNGATSGLLTMKKSVTLETGLSN